MWHGYEVLVFYSCSLAYVEECVKPMRRIADNDSGPNFGRNKVKKIVPVMALCYDIDSYVFAPFPSYG